jgi:hypothetical protein
MPAAYTSQYFATTGGILSVSTFANLPATATTGQRISITGESSLFNTATHPAIVRWSGVVWELESAAATYLNIAAVEFANGTWTGTGGTTVGTKSGALVRDITYYDEWVWNSTSNIFVPKYLGLTTIGNQQKIKGDSLTLEAGWTSQVDATCTLVVDGGNKLFATAYGNSVAPNARYTRFYFTDTAGTGNTNNFYMKCLLQRTTLTMGSTGGVNLYIRHDSGFNGKIVEFGDGSATSGSITINGKFMDRTGGWSTIYTATANRGDTWTSETLVQFRVIAGATNALGIAQVKIGTGGWHDISVGTCRTGAGTLRFEVGVAGANNPLNVAAMKLRYLQAIRYT